MKEGLSKYFIKIFNNSAIDKRQTLLFGHKKTLFKPYLVTLSNGQEIEVKSKIEGIIAKALSSFNVVFEYEPLDFMKEYRFKPDFRIRVNNRVYYWEHLGNIGPKYTRRWQWKITAYKKIGVFEDLITTSEDENTTNVENSIKKIVQDLNNGNLKLKEGEPSRHHYYI
jgi:predicted nuclease of restriction endonuclease-like RecB superfamily